MNLTTVQKIIFATALTYCSPALIRGQNRLTDAVQPGALQAGNKRLSTAPLLFTENLGQAVDDRGRLRADILFTAHSGGAKIFLTATGIHYQFVKTDYPQGYPRSAQTAEGCDSQEFVRSRINTSAHRFTLSLEGSNAHPRIRREGQSSYTENFYLAHCPQGITGAHTYARIIMEDVYPGIDWIVYSSNSGLEYDFMLKPGADPAQIKLRVTDADAADITADGSLRMQTSLGAVTEAPPVSFSEGRKVATHFVKDANGSIGFVLGQYNYSKPVTIDPSVSWASYYGGSGDDDGDACAVDGSGNVYLAGTTGSTSGIASSGGFQTTSGGGAIARDAFLVKFNSAGVRLWATYYGGAGIDVTNSCATDAGGNVYLAGNTTSASGIASGGAQNVKGDTTDAFLVKFDGSGARQWATYFGGTGSDNGNGCATDKSGNVFLSGSTSGSVGLGSGGFQNTSGGSADAFLVKYSAAGAKQWSTYYGGSGIDDGYSCATDTAGNVYLAGITGSSSGIAAAGAAQPAFGGGYADAFLVKFDPAGVRLWSTYYGGSDHDGQTPSHCATDGAGNVFLSGTTRSANAIASGGFQNTFGGIRDGFLVKFSATGARAWATYYGGTDDDAAQSCTVDPSGNVYLSGGTGSSSGIASSGFLNALPGNAAGYAAKFDGAGARLWGSYYRIGGDNALNATSCAADGSGNVYLAGLVGPTSIATTGGFQNTFGGGNSDAVLTKISDNGTPQGIGGMPAAWPGDVFVFPNPSAGSFTVEGAIDALHVGKTINIALYNSLGQCVYISSLQPQGRHFSKEILVGNAVANGWYHLRMDAGDMAVAKAILIRR